MTPPVGLHFYQLSIFRHRQISQEKLETRYDTLCAKVEYLSLPRRSDRLIRFDTHSAHRIGCHRNGLLELSILDLLFTSVAYDADWLLMED